MGGGHISRGQFSAGGGGELISLGGAVFGEEHRLPDTCTHKNTQRTNNTRTTALERSIYKPTEGEEGRGKGWGARGAGGWRGWGGG